MKTRRCKFEFSWWGNLSSNRSWRSSV